MEILKILSLIATPCIAVAVAMIARGQLETARLKLVFDLFEKRLELYERLHKATLTFQITRSNSPSDAHEEFYSELKSIKSKARFLFGREVERHITLLNIAATDISVKERHSVERAATAENYIASSNETLPKLFGPYLKIDSLRPGAEPYTITHPFEKLNRN